MNTNKNKNASHLTHEMKNEHGGLAEAGMKADTQPIFKALWSIAQKKLKDINKQLKDIKRHLKQKKRCIKS